MYIYIDIYAYVPVAAKMGPAAQFLVNETSLSSTSHEHGQADHGAV